MSHIDEIQSMLKVLGVCTDAQIQTGTAVVGGGAVIDTPDRINTLAGEVNDWFLSYQIDGATVSEVKAALSRYAELLEQVAAHGKVCAGEWVSVEERLPAVTLKYEGEVDHPAPRYPGQKIGPLHESDAVPVYAEGRVTADVVMRFEEMQKPIWAHTKNATHWIETRGREEE